jgi:putative heme-binding domain-containing protein
MALKDWTKRTSITRGKYVGAGDPFESLRPGYQAVQDQLVTPRFDVPVLGTMLTANRRTVLINVPEQVGAVNYAVALPRLPNRQKPKGNLPQQNQIDLQTDLCGVEATWTANENSSNRWSGWLPHLDSTVSRAFTSGSLDHDAFWKLCSAPGELRLRTQLNLWQMLEPSVQPGAKIDYTPPPEEVIIDFEASQPFHLYGQRDTASDEAPNRSRFYADLKTRPTAGTNWIPVELTMKTGHSIDLRISWHTSDDPRPRALPLRRMLLPWGSPETDAPSAGKERRIPEIAGGNWLHGKRVFFSETTGCFKCHSIRSEGGHIGPDLSNLVSRDYASVLRDITAPNATINPDHLTYNVDLQDGTSVTGVVIGDSTNEMVLGLVSGQPMHLAKKQIASAKPSTISLMPEGLVQALTASQLKDLMTFLLTSPLEPAAIEASGEPPARSHSALPAFRNSDSASAEPRPIRILLSTGPKDHGPGEHDYPLWGKRWKTLLSLADGVDVRTIEGFPTAENLKSANVVVFYSDNPGWSAEKAPELEAFLKRGGGLVYLHYAVDGLKSVDELSQIIGLAWRGGGSKFRHGALDLTFLPHPLAGGLSGLKLVDESYWQLVGDEKNIQRLASGMEEGAPRPLIWTREQGAGRVFVSIPGHYTWTFDDPLFRIVILRGIAWAAHEPPDRFAELTTIGARLRE